MKAQEIVDYVFEIAPNPAWAWENMFEFGDGELDVTGVAVAWWITSEFMHEMVRKGLNFGITHETTYYELPQRFMWGKLGKSEDLEVNKKINRIANENHLAIHRFHCNIDVVEWGMPHALLRQLGWEEYSADWSRGVPVVNISPCSLRELIGHVKARLRLPFVRYDGDLDRTIKHVAIPWGGLCQGWSGPACAEPLGFDAVIGGDILDGVVRMAREYDWAVIDAMHHATELEAMKVLAEKLQAKFPALRVEYFENSMPWSVICD